MSHDGYTKVAVSSPPERPLFAGERVSRCET